MSATLRGIERVAVFNRLRAAVGLRWELPPLLNAVADPPGSRCLEIGTGLGWGPWAVAEGIVAESCDD
jgi:hypothetical protein